jgi:hypothetical protein
VFVEIIAPIAGMMALLFSPRKKNATEQIKGN